MRVAYIFTTPMLSCCGNTHSMPSSPPHSFHKRAMIVGRLAAYVWRFLWLPSYCCDGCPWWLPMWWLPMMDAPILLLWWLAHDAHVMAAMLYWGNLCVRCMCVCVVNDVCACCANAASVKQVGLESTVWIRWLLSPYVNDMPTGRDAFILWRMHETLVNPSTFLLGKAISLLGKY